MLQVHSGYQSFLARSYRGGSPSNIVLSVRQHMTLDNWSLMEIVYPSALSKHVHTLLPWQIEETESKQHENLLRLSK
jgi:hypothetical protein